jgi:hypothetical protein
VSRRLLDVARERSSTFEAELGTGVCLHPVQRYLYSGASCWTTTPKSAILGSQGPVDR